MLLTNTTPFGRGGFPHVTSLVQVEYDLDLDALFELGLRCLLDGLREIVPGSG